ncbi:hypothetical protein J1N10_13330 [Carboxylicivirga sp. A043]|uniref:OprO/OprP family phosphate-selective porin n=1 Tax=Carboxylicivirga litoralis TaxID=2816963 RepID=UPI0021CB6D25|nr:OprO/OprP family phosphate-selective porin [Carboxylicivirga sp. A043]MCU4156965.1 hypothetical protein [Carboxylicivirga sp. A043]
MKRFLLVGALVALVCLGNAEAQTIKDLSAQVGKGIQFKTEDDLFYLKFATRIQTRWDFENTLSNSQGPADFVNKAWVKRARIKFDGYFLNKSLVYKIEYDVAGGYVRDAIIKYKKNNCELWFGQGKLPSNRERVVSSGDLQLVDRSVFNKYYTLDRDPGVQFHHKIKAGKAVFYDRWAVTAGNGIRDNEFSPGISLTGKIEALPLGEFKSKGAYKMADLSREETPKIAFAAYANYNVDANKDRGQLGDLIYGEADLLNFGGDFLFKYRGYSFMIEAAKRLVTDDNEFVYDDLGEIEAAYYTGYGANVQTGYVFKNNWELSGRYSFTKPNETAFHSEITDYTVGISKYIIGHKFKFQGDVTFRDRLNKQDKIITRLQMEFQF